MHCHFIYHNCQPRNMLWGSSLAKTHQHVFCCTILCKHMFILLFIYLFIYHCLTFQSDSPLLPMPFIMTSAWANSYPKLSSLDTSLDASKSISSRSVLKHVFIAAPPSSSSPPAWTICLGRLILCVCMSRWWLCESVCETVGERKRKCDAAKNRKRHNEEFVNTSQHVGNKTLESTLCRWNRPEEVVVSPQDSVTVMKLDWNCDCSTIHTCPTETTFEMRKDVVYTAVTANLFITDQTAPNIKNSEQSWQWMLAQILSFFLSPASIDLAYLPLCSFGIFQWNKWFCRKNVYISHSIKILFVSVQKLKLSHRHCLKCFDAN